MYGVPFRQGSWREDLPICVSNALWLYSQIYHAHSIKMISDHVTTGLFLFLWRWVTPILIKTAIDCFLHDHYWGTWLFPLPSPCSSLPHCPLESSLPFYLWRSQVTISSLTFQDTQSYLCMGLQFSSSYHVIRPRREHFRGNLTYHFPTENTVAYDTWYLWSH